MRKINEAGFTLAESLVVLAITGVLLLLAVPVSAKHLEQHKEQTFLDMLEMDILYAQNEAMSRKEGVTMYLDENEYKIHTIKRGTLVQRELPSPYKFIGHYSYPVISFNQNGSVRKAGHVAFRTRGSLYSLVLPPGKGRAYVEKQ